MKALIGRSSLISAILLALCLVATPAFADTPANHDQMVNRVVELVNQERAREGIAPMTLNAQLNTAAQGYAELLSSTTCFDHTCGPVPNFTDRMRNAGYNGFNAAAENIAAGQQTPEAVMTGWMSSPGHRANIMNPAYNELGVGVATSNGRFRIYWSQSFGHRIAAAAPARAPAFQPIFPIEPAPEEMAPLEEVPVEEAPAADELPVEEEPVFEEA